MKIILAQINPIVGDLTGNREKILAEISKAKVNGAHLTVFPELALTGYPPEDLLLLPEFILAVEKHLEEIANRAMGIAVICGTPRRNLKSVQKPLFNSAALLADGKIQDYYDKQLLPTYDVFDELRYFEPGLEAKVWRIENYKIAISICEDMWGCQAAKFTAYARDPMRQAAAHQPDLMINLSASPFDVAKPMLRMAVCQQAAAALKAPFILCNQVGGNDSLIFDGHSLALNKDGTLHKIAAGYAEDHLTIEFPFSGENAIAYAPNPIEELHNALVLGVKDYFHKSGIAKACLGLSGGIDSALVACIAAQALGKENVLGVMMPSRYSSEGSIKDAEELVKNLGIAAETIPIETPFTAYLDLLQPAFAQRPQDVTEENLQARIRGMILMALSNKFGYVVLSTGNKSELAMGYSTLYGDMCGGLSVISDVSKRQVYQLAAWINRNGVIIPLNTIHKPPSAELRPGQKDSDSLPDYDIIDNVLESYIEEHMPPQAIAEKFGYPLELVHSLIRRIHNNEYKRRQSPPGLRISQKAFSVGRRFPIVQRWVR